MNSHKRGRTCSLYRQARAGQVQLVRYVGAEEIFIVADMRHPGSVPGQESIALVRHEIAHNDSPRPGKYTSNAVFTPWVIPRVFESLPSDFEEEAVLRVDEACFFRRVAKK